MISDKKILEIFYDLVKNRSSKRLFSDEIMSTGQIKKLLECASYAPSACNVQPWKCYIATGSLIETLKKEFHEAYRNQKRSREISYKIEYTKEQLEKKNKCDEKILSALIKSNNDLQARFELVKSSWKFFNAPQALFLTIPENLFPYGLLDLGCFLQNFLLAIEANNLGACPQIALAEFPQIVRNYFSLSDTEIIVCGVSFGNIKENNPINQIKTARQNLDDFVTIKGGDF